MYNYKIKTNFVSLEMIKTRANITDFNIMIVHYYICRKLHIIHTIHDFPILLKSGSNPADIIRFRSHTGKVLLTIVTAVSPLFHFIYLK